MRSRCAPDRECCALLIALILLIDILTKAWARIALYGAASVRVIPGVINFTFHFNQGAAFSMLRGRPTLVTIISALVLIALLVTVLLSKRVPQRAYLATSLVFAGGAGNLLDRVRFGAVVDFIELAFMRFPIFNFADICVSAGALLFAVWLFTPRGKGGARA